MKYICAFRLVDEQNTFDLVQRPSEKSSHFFYFGYANLAKYRFQMKNNLIRIGTADFVNKSALLKINAFDLLFNGFYEFVYLPDYYPWLLVNGTWTGALGHLMDDNRMDWKTRDPRNITTPKS